MASKTAKKKKRLKNKCTKLCRRIVFWRDGYACRRCGKTSSLQNSHILPKSHYGIYRFDPGNCKVLCAGCHLFWWHDKAGRRDPAEHIEWLETQTDLYEKYLENREDYKTNNLKWNTVGFLEMKLEELETYIKDNNIPEIQDGRTDTGANGDF